jgi:hypothetical protein
MCAGGPRRRGQEGTGALRAVPSRSQVKKLPAPEPTRHRELLKLGSGVRYEVQQRERGREIEVIPLRFEREGTGLVLVG